ncbi:MAG: nitroreductase [Alphaproteobacteria bacterium]|nr:MAG: nitroreductase [Alphaproteobacteria bacterium]
MTAADLDSFEAIARRRRSVRAFLPDAVDRASIERAIAAAGTAPSSCNTQPWKLHIASGATLDRLRHAFIDAARSRAARAPEVEHAQPYRGAYRDRQIDAAVRLFAAQGVERHDKQGRIASFLRNYDCFGAPHAAFLFMRGDGGPREAADCGKFAQTFMLALAAAGIGSCPQGSLSDYPAIVRETLGLQEEGRLLMGISFGYPDENDPSAAVRPARMPLEDLVQFH